jgi:molecular chaperone GrpE
MKKPVFLRGSAVESKEAESRAEQQDETAADAEMDFSDADTVPENSAEQTAAAEDEVTTSSESKVDHEHVKRLESEVKENFDKYIRAVAELENFKKRALRERSDLLRYAGENLARDLLEIADNFQLAFAQSGINSDDEFVKGIKMIQDRFTAILEQHAVRSESALGGQFDPNKQQALVSVPTTDAAPGTILEEFKKAYYFKDKLLRPGQVVVATAVEAESTPPADLEKSE